MTTPPIEPPEPETPEPRPEPPREYDMHRLWWSAGITLAIIAVATVIFAPVALVIPVALLVDAAFISRYNSPTKRATVAGIALGCGVGLLVSAGICTLVFNGVIPSVFT